MIQKSEKQQSNGTGTSEYKSYIGRVEAKVIAFNPNEDILKQFFGENAKAVKYKVDDKNGGYIMPSFIVKVVSDCPLMGKAFRVNFFVKKVQGRKSKSNTIEYIDGCGNNAWLKEEEIKKKTVPDKSKMKWEKDGKLFARPAFDGEARLKRFLKIAYNSSFDNEIKYNMLNLLNGDFSELENDVKAIIDEGQVFTMAVGVRKSERIVQKDGDTITYTNMYQEINPDLITWRINPNTDSGKKSIESMNKKCEKACTDTQKFSFCELTEVKSEELFSNKTEPVEKAVESAKTKADSDDLPF